MSDATPKLPAAAPRKLRIDKWLWAARFYKTRSLASEAIARNQIRIDGQRIKASRTISVGELVIIRKPPYEIEITVLALNDQRRPASEARTLYEETPQSVERREITQQQLRNDRIARLGLAGSGRPNKKQRRQIIRFQNKHDSSDDTSGE